MQRTLQIKPYETVRDRSVTFILHVYVYGKETKRKKGQLAWKQHRVKDKRNVKHEKRYETEKTRAKYVHAQAKNNT